MTSMGLGDDKQARPALSASASELRRLLTVIEEDILPVTREGVARGNKVFGAAVLSERPELCTVVADTNNELECPLFHGEVYVLQKWAAQTPAEQRGANAARAVFLSTHEPCCMCISAIVWAGFSEVFYFFPYESTRKQGIPHDIEIMHELWDVPTYRKQNKFCSTACVVDLIDALPESSEKTALQACAAKISQEYDALSQKYHAEKASNPANSITFS